MSTPKELLAAGKLGAALTQLTQEVKAKPGDASLRIFLFELLLFSGDLERAEKQLEVVGHVSTEMQIGTGLYRQLIDAERMRRSVFDEGGLPGFVLPPPEYAALHLEALSACRAQDFGAARAALEKALDLEPGVAGTADGKAFSGFEDSDPFFGPFLEVIVNQKYVWLPFEQITRLEIRKPVQLRDMAWARGKVEVTAGDLGEVFLPVLYPGSFSHGNEAVKLGRMTDWITQGEGLVRGAGQRLFVIDGDERAMLEVGDLTFSAKGETKTAQQETPGSHP